jgi:hypothetical protein
VSLRLDVRLHEGVLELVGDRGLELERQGVALLDGPPRGDHDVQGHQVVAADLAGANGVDADPPLLRELAEQTGFDVEYSTGTSLIRKKGSKLEDYPTWIRLNQIGASLFPAMGQELCMQLRKPAS